MGLRCLLGHDFDEPEVEREREEDGDEMVVTIREVKTCDRCGERQIVSENKEVTSIRTAEEVGLDGADRDDEGEAEDDRAVTHPAVDDEASPDEPFDPLASAEEDDGVILPDEPAEREPGAWPDHDGDEAADADDGAADDTPEEAPSLGADEVATEDEIHRATDEADDADDAVEDDAEFIDADDADELVAWPEHDHATDADDADDAAAGEPAAWPEQTGDDEGFSAHRSSEVDESYDGSEVSFGGGLAPEASNGTGRDRDGTPDAEFVGTPEADDTGEDFVRADNQSVELETQLEGQPTEYFCPNCGYTRGGAGSSMRAGDICPECQQGYIAEREA